jgi:hypothetical protein
VSMPRVMIVVANTFAVGACSTPYLLTEWGSVQPTSIPLVCGNGGYDVRTKDSRILVTAYAVTEAIRSCGTTVASAPASARYQDAAAEFLVRTGKPQCRINSGREIDQLHSEFTFTCPKVLDAPMTGARGGARR